MKKYVLVLACLAQMHAPLFALIESKKFDSQTQKIIKFLFLLNCLQNGRFVINGQEIKYSKRIMDYLHKKLVDLQYEIVDDLIPGTLQRRNEDNH